jgi:hypothetical protein
VNRRQRAILVDIVTVILVTVVAVAVILNLRDYFNRRAAKLAMTVLGNRIKMYRTEYGFIPSESWVDGQRDNLPGEDRLGELNYRARWIDLESDPNEILCFSEKRSRSILYADGYFVLRLKEVLGWKDRDIDVNIEWMDKKEFEDLLAQQQSPLEIEMQYK